MRDFFKNNIRTRWFLIPASVIQGIMLTRRELVSILLFSILSAMVTIHIIRLPKRKLNAFEYIGLGIIQVAVIIRFYARELNARNIELSGRIDIGILLLAGVMGLIGYWYILQLASHIYSDTEELRERATFPKSRLLYSFVCTVFMITFCSECSFLYPINSWVDANCFLTVGKAWTHGFVPYRDILEQKGPVLYFFYGIASLIKSDSFLGVYLLEIVSGTVFLYYMAKAVSLYGGEKVEYLTIPLIAIITGISSAFKTGGSTEEFSLPLLAYALYISLKKIKYKESFSVKQYILIGVSIGCILWAKFTLLGFYIGWFFFFVICFIHEKGYREIRKMILCLACGICIVTFPIILYFGLNHALSDLFKVYFYDNIFLYPGYQDKGMIQGLIQYYLRGITFLFKGNLLVVFLFIFGWIGTRKSKESYFLLLSFVFLFLSSFLGKFTWDYYTLPFVVFAVPGIGIIVRDVRLNLRRFSCCLAALPLLCFFMTTNRANLGVRRDETPQYAFADKIKQSENPTLLNYGFLDGGFYLAADIIPNCKAFCQLAAPIPEMYEEQEKALEQGGCEYVVTQTELNNPKYLEIQQMNGYRLYHIAEEQNR